MPADAIPFVIVIVAFFATFIVAVGGASLWTALPTPKGRSRPARQRRSANSGSTAQAHAARHNA
jgi:hypothetical protein